MFSKGFGLSNPGSASQLSLRVCTVYDSLMVVVQGVVLVLVVLVVTSLLLPRDTLNPTTRQLYMQTGYYKVETSCHLAPGTYHLPPTTFHLPPAGHPRRHEEGGGQTEPQQEAPEGPEEDEGPPARAPRQVTRIGLVKIETLDLLFSLNDLSRFMGACMEPGQVN